MTMTPKEAYEFAEKYDSSDEIRKIACQDPYYAYVYARNIDKESRDDTREAACKDLKYACLYAKNVDKGFHQETWNAIKNTKYEKEYKNFFRRMEKDKII